MSCSFNPTLNRFPVVLLALWLVVLCGQGHAAPKPNLLLITVDDMSADSVGAYGAAVEDTTPNIDRIAREGLYFRHAHVQVANCTPSRNVMWSGRYPHSSGVEGFYQVRDPGYPTLSDLLQDAGYFTAIRGKVDGSTPYAPYGWDQVLDGQHHRKDAASYGLSTMQGIRAAQAAGKPFALMINISDPHVPFYGVDKKGNPVEDVYEPSRIYGPKEVAIPGFLVDDEVVRLELSHYYTTVRRADDAVGHVLDALGKSGEADATLVMFLSDHGMPFPFAKTQLYHHSTWTPLIFRWPGVIAPNSVDGEHMVSAVDILPTLLDAVGVPHPDGLQGRSLLPLLQGRQQVERNRVFKEYNENSKGVRAPMRAVQDERYLYIFNPWSDGKRVMASATKSTRTHKRMLELSEKDAWLAGRLHLLNYRVPEELYDVGADPDCLVNLAGDAAHAAELRRLRSELEQWMRRTADPVLEAFLHRDDTEFLAGFMDGQERASQERREHERERYWRAILERIREGQLEKSGPASKGDDRGA
jgi:N-sulfoglucosamine sulfohydrolase